MIRTYGTKEESTFEMSWLDWKRTGEPSFGPLPGLSCLDSFFTLLVWAGIRSEGHFLWGMKGDPGADEATAGLWLLLLCHLANANQERVVCREELGF